MMQPSVTNKNLLQTLTVKWSPAPLGSCPRGSSYQSENEPFVRRHYDDFCVHVGMDSGAHRVQVPGGGTGRKTGNLKTKLNLFGPVVLRSATKSKGWPHEVVLIMTWP